MTKWLPIISKEGIMFFFDKSSGSCQWVYPKEYNIKTQKYENIFFKDWVKQKDNKNKYYWKNSKNGIIQYIKPSSTTFILEAALLDNFAFIELYFEYNGDINFNDNQQRNALHYACMNDNEKMVKLLIKLGCEINKKDYIGNTPLIYSIMYHSYKSLKTLIEYNANVNLKNNNGNTPLHYAIKNKNNKLIIYLINHGGDIGEKNKKGEYPIDWAVKDNNWSLVNLITKLSNIIYTEKSYSLYNESSESDNEINTNKIIKEENKNINLDKFENLIFESKRNSKFLDDNINKRLLHLNLKKEIKEDENDKNINKNSVKNLSINDINFNKEEEEDEKEENEDNNNKKELILINKKNIFEKEEDNKSLNNSNIIDLNNEKDINISNMEKSINLSKLNLERKVINTSTSKKIKKNDLKNSNIDNSIISNNSTLNTTNISKLSQVSTYITTTIFPIIKTFSEKIKDYFSILYNKINSCSKTHSQKIFRNLNKLYHNLYIYYFNPPDIENQIEYLRYSIELENLFGNKKNDNNENNKIKDIKKSKIKFNLKKKHNINPFQQREFHKYIRIKKKKKKKFIYSIPLFHFYNFTNGKFNKKKLKNFIKPYNNKFIKILFSSPLIKNELYKQKDLNKNELLITSFQENKLDQSIKLDPIIIKHIKNLTETLNSLEKSNEINTNKKYIIPKLNLYKKNESESESEKEEEEEEEKIIHTNRSNTSAYEHIFKSLNNINKIIDNATSDRKNIRESIIDKREENWDNLEPSLMNNNHNNSTVTFNNEENDLENILKDYNFQLNLLKERENEKMEQSISISSNFFSIIDKKNN